MAEAEEPGYLTLADARANRHMTNPYNATDGDTRDMQQYALTADVALSDRLDWTAQGWLNRLRDDRYVKFSAGASQQRRLTLRTITVHQARCTGMAQSAQAR